MVMFGSAIIDAVACLATSFIIRVACALSQTRAQVRAVCMDITATVDVCGVGAWVVDLTGGAITIVPFIAVAHGLARLYHFTRSSLTAATVIDFTRIMGSAIETIAREPMWAFACASATACLCACRKSITIAPESRACINTITSFAIPGITTVASAFVLGDAGHSTQTIVTATTILKFTVIYRFTVTFGASTGKAWLAHAAMCARAGGVASRVLVTVATIWKLAIIDGSALYALTAIASIAGADGSSWKGHRASGMNVATTIAGKAYIYNGALGSTASVTEVTCT